MMKNHKSTKSQSLLKVNNRTKIREPTKISAVTVDKPNILLEPDNKDESENAATPMLENELVYSCLLCDFRTDSKFDLNQHKSQKHVKGEGGKGIILSTLPKNSISICYIIETKYIFYLYYDVIAYFKISFFRGA